MKSSHVLQISKPNLLRKFCDGADLDCMGEICVSEVLIITLLRHAAPIGDHGPEGLWFVGEDGSYTAVRSKSSCWTRLIEKRRLRDEIARRPSSEFDRFLAG